MLNAEQIAELEARLTPLYVNAVDARNAAQEVIAQLTEIRMWLMEVHTVAMKAEIARRTESDG